MNLLSSFANPSPHLGVTGYGGRVRTNSAATLALPLANGNWFIVDGNDFITRLPASTPTGLPVTLLFTGTPTMVHWPRLLLPGNANIKFAAGDSATLLPVGDGSWRCISRGDAAAAQGVRRFIFEGDSISNPSNLGLWPSYLPTTGGFFARPATFVYSAQDADTAAGMAADRATEVTPYMPRTGSGDEVWYFLYVGTNDIDAGTSAATIYAALQAEWAAVKAAGAKVVAFTIMPSTSHDATESAVRVALNALILSDPTLYDFMCRPDMWFPDATDTLNFLDGKHLTAAGNRTFAHYVAQTLSGTRCVYPVPSDGMPGGIAINGGMGISQQNGSTLGTADGYYPVDKFTMVKAGSVGFEAVQIADAPRGLKHSLKVTITSTMTPGSTDALLIRTKHEGSRIRRLMLGTTSANWQSVYWIAKSSVAMTLGFTATNSAVNRSFPSTFTHAATNDWELFRVFIPGDVTGTWLDSAAVIGEYMNWTLSCGSSFAGAAGAWAGTTYLGATGQGNLAATNGATFQLAGVVVLPGVHYLTMAEVVQIIRAEQDDLALCKREYQVSQGGIGIAFSTTAFQALVSHKGMCKVPTVGASAAITATHPTGGNFTQSAASAAVGTTQSVDDSLINLANFTGLISGNTYMVYGGGGKILFDARI